jgi:hypothetical protein
MDHSVASLVVTAFIAIVGTVVLVYLMRRGQTTAAALEFAVIALLLSLHLSFVDCYALANKTHSNSASPSTRRPRPPAS